MKKKPNPHTNKFLGLLGLLAAIGINFVPLKYQAAAQASLSALLAAGVAGSRPNGVSSEEAGAK